MAVPSVSAAQLNPMIQLVKAMNKGKEKAQKNAPKERQQASRQQQQASRAGAKGQESSILSQLAQVLTNGSQQGAAGSQLKSGLQKGGLQNAGGAEGASGAEGAMNMSSEIAEFMNELKKVLGNMKGKGDLKKAGKQLSKSDNPIAKRLGKMLKQASDKALDEDGNTAEKKSGCCSKKDNAEAGATGGMAQAGLNGLNATDGANNLRKAQGNDAADDASGGTSDKMRSNGNDPMGEINMEDQKAGEPFEDFLFRVMAAVTKDLQKEIRQQVQKIKSLSAASAGATGAAATTAADSKMLAMEKLKQLTQKLQQAFQALSNVQNNLHNAAMNSVRNIK